MIYGSLFSGIGGIDLGLDRAGMTCAWQVESNRYCREVLARHWPLVDRYDCVTRVGKDDLMPVNLICGGFPCQDISYAGKGAGLHGKKSGLWSEYIRIVREIRPRYVLVENVPALLARGIDRVLGDLAEIGYDAEWDCLPAAAFGAPHRRDRLFIVAHTGRQRSPEHHTATSGRKQGVFDRVAIPSGPSWPSESGVVRVGDGVPNDVDRIRALGNAVVPQVAEALGQAIMSHARDWP